MVLSAPTCCRTCMFGLCVSYSSVVQTMPGNTVSFLRNRKENTFPSKMKFYIKTPNYFLLNVVLPSATFSTPYVPRFQMNSGSAIIDNLTALLVLYRVL